MTMHHQPYISVIKISIRNWQTNMKFLFIVVDTQTYKSGNQTRANTASTTFT